MNPYEWDKTSGWTVTGIHSNLYHEHEVILYVVMNKRLLEQFHHCDMQPHNPLKSVNSVVCFKTQEGQTMKSYKSLTLKF